MNKEKALDRIRKCLALSESKNPNESAIALRQARKLMEKYGLTAESLESKGHSFFDLGFKRPPVWALLVVGLCGDAFGCTYFKNRGGKAVFVGEKDSVAIARYAYEVVSRQLKNNLEKFKAISPDYAQAGAGRKRKLSQSYCEAWAVAAGKVVKEFAKPMTAERAGELTRYFQSALEQPVDIVRHSSVRIVSDHTTAQAVRSGLNDGENVRIHTPLSGADCAGVVDRDRE